MRGGTAMSNTTTFADSGTASYTVEGPSTPALAAAAAAAAATAAAYAAAAAALASPLSPPLYATEATSAGPAPTPAPGPAMSTSKDMTAARRRGTREPSIKLARAHKQFPNGRDSSEARPTRGAA